MGAWGVESCSSDSCWDLLGDGGIADIHDPQQEDVDACMEKTIATDQCTYYPRCRLGVAVWLLDHGMTLKDEHLAWAEDEVDTFIAEYETAVAEKKVAPDDEYISNLRDERDRIIAARMRDGQGSEHHVPGLMEKMVGMVAEGQGGLVNYTEPANG